MSDNARRPTPNDGISERYERLKSRVAASAARAGRNADEVRIMAVTKTHPVETLKAAIDTGIRLFGENRADELLGKFERKTEGVEIHMIGHLQRNKARMIAHVADCVQSIDKYSTAAALEKACSENGHTMPILLEYNTSGEASKYGFSSIEASLEDIERICALRYVEIKGVMTIAPFTDDTKPIRESFRALRGIYEVLEERFSLGMDTISMGMTNDFEIAVEEGSTLIRVGSFLFGPRS
jgi:PLP dependent protein